MARILGVTNHQAKKLMRRYAYAAGARGDPPTYDARIVDFIRATHGQPHRELVDVRRDWLSRYQEGKQ